MNMQQQQQRYQCSHASVKLRSFSIPAMLGLCRYVGQAQAHALSKCLWAGLPTWAAANRPLRPHARPPHGQQHTAYSSQAATERTYDVLVLGLGAYGAATTHYLARAGARVLGLERYSEPGHGYGSSHGHTRITRTAYREGMQYFPLLQRSWQLVKQLQEQHGKQLLLETGILEIARTAAATSLASSQQYGLRHEVLTGSEVSSRFPGFNIPSDFVGMFQPDAGILSAEPIMQACCDGAKAAGATLLWDTKVVSWQPTAGGGVEVKTASGEQYSAAQLVVAAGPWMTDLLPETKVLLQPVRQVVAWFKVWRPQLFKPSAFPVFILDINQYDSPADAAVLAHSPTAQQQVHSLSWYGFPQWGPQPGFKIGLYNHLNEHNHPDTMNRAFTAEDEAALRMAVDTYFPAASGPVLKAQPCIFTNTTDGHFLVDRHPVHPQVIICSACSGHGFKMSLGVGQLIAEDVMSWQGSSAASASRGRADSGQEELGFARISTQRPGHTAFLEACHQQLR